jgi:hypothetical protein
VVQEAHHPIATEATPSVEEPIPVAEVQAHAEAPVEDTAPAKKTRKTKAQKGTKPVLSTRLEDLKSRRKKAREIQ